MNVLSFYHSSTQIFRVLILGLLDQTADVNWLKQHYGESMTISDLTY